MASTLAPAHSGTPPAGHDPNQRDALGNTPLMTAITASATAALAGIGSGSGGVGASGAGAGAGGPSGSPVLSPSQFQSLAQQIRSPRLNINLQDLESGYTLLHKALYNGHLALALFMLRSRPDVDLTLKDKEGYTCLDLLNASMKLHKLFDGDDHDALDGRWMHRRHDHSAVRHTTDSDSDESTGRDANADADADPDAGSSNDHADADLVGSVPGSQQLNPAMSVWSWGSNSNYVLGQPNSDDRTLPERLDLTSSLSASIAASVHAIGDYDPQIQQVVMSKYHACILTRKRLYTHGFGPGGRLGLGHEETTMRPTEVPGLSGAAEFVAVGPDHTIAILDDGAVWTWGSNEHSQLGYTVETRSRTPKQLTPRQVQLKKITCVGAAGSKFHSIVFTNAGAIYTWGTNKGQLGYDQPVQSTPRKVTSFPLQPILQVCATNSSSAVLVATNDVYVFAESKTTRVMFPATQLQRPLAMHRQSSESRVPRVRKLVTGNHQYAALLTSGDVYMWSPPDPQYRDSWQQLNFPQRRPRLVWSVRKKHLAARDVGVGIDSSIIVGTDSGHVFVGSRRVVGGGVSAAKERPAVYVSPRVAAAAAAAAAASGASVPGLAAGIAVANAVASAGAAAMGDAGAKDGAVFFKYTKVPNLQHIVQVAASSCGAFAALRSDRRPNQVVVDPSSLASDMCKVLYPVRRMGIQRPSHAAEASELERTLSSSTLSSWFGMAGQSPKSASTDPQQQVSPLQSAHHLLPPPALASSLTASVPWTDDSLPAGSRAGGYDVEILVEGGVRVLAHRIILSLRSRLFRQAFMDGMGGGGGPVIAQHTQSGGKRGGNAFTGNVDSAIKIASEPSEDGLVSVSMPHTHPATLMCLLEFMYTGRFRRLWDNSVLLPSSQAGRVSPTSNTGPSGKKNSAGASAYARDPEPMPSVRIHQEFTRLAKILRLDETEILHSTIETQNAGVPLDSPAYFSTSDRFRTSFTSLSRPPFRHAFTDVVVEIEGGDTVAAHAVILASRCQFFDAVLGRYAAWHLSTHEDTDMPVVRLPHLSRRVFDTVLAWIYGDVRDPGQLLSLHRSRSGLSLQEDDASEADGDEDGDEEHADMAAFVVYVLDVLAASNELLLDQLKDICSTVLCRVMDIKNVIAILEFAELYHAYKLKHACLDFICWNLETFLEGRSLLDLSDDLVLEIQQQMHELQVRKLPIMRGPHGYYAQRRQRAVRAEEIAKDRKRQEHEERRRLAAELLARPIVPPSPETMAIGSLSSSLQSPVVRPNGQLRCAAPDPFVLDGGDAASAGDGARDDDSIFQLDMDTDAAAAASRSPALSAVSFSGSVSGHGARRSSDAGIATSLSTSAPRKGKPVWVKLDGDLEMDSPRIAPSTSVDSSTSPQLAPSSGGRVWSPVTKAQDHKGRPSLRNIMNEALEQHGPLAQSAAHPAMDAGRPPVPNPTKRSPAFAPVSTSMSQTFSPRGSASNAPPLQSQPPFFLGEPHELFSLPAAPAAPKLSQKQRKQQARDQQQQQQQPPVQQPVPPSPPTKAWGAVSTAVEDAAIAPVAAATASGAKSLRQIQEEEEMFRRMKVSNTQARASLLSPAVMSAESKSGPSMPGWTGSGWNTSPSPVPSVPTAFSVSPAPTSMARSSPASSKADRSLYPFNESAPSPTKRHSSGTILVSFGSPMITPTQTADRGRSTPSPSPQQQQQQQQKPLPKQGKRVSLVSIQREQENQAQAQIRMLKKPLSRIQIEETAMRQIREFYMATQVLGEGEWVTIHNHES
ncbi:hypothetical protein BC831DRAFT_449843 [Entophlyctis helioformis]|nr:hypothetical protein BC831DRAFT_449843 [Entophlyctis helioformis]